MQIYRFPSLIRVNAASQVDDFLNRLRSCRPKPPVATHPVSFHFGGNLLLLICKVDIQIASAAAAVAPITHTKAITFQQ